MLNGTGGGRYDNLIFIWDKIQPLFLLAEAFEKMNVGLLTSTGLNKLSGCSVVSSHVHWDTAGRIAFDLIFVLCSSPTKMKLLISV